MYTTFNVRDIVLKSRLLQLTKKKFFLKNGQIKALGSDHFCHLKSFIVSRTRNDLASGCKWRIGLKQ